jgi:DNA polymerase-3 subunit delta'
VIDIADQPLAAKVLAGALGGTHVPQQFLFYGPAGTGKRAAALAVAHRLIGAPEDAGERALLDLSVVRASGQELRIEDLEGPLRDLATRPVVGRRRVAIIEGAERLSQVTGNRMLKPLEEPPAGSHVILVTDRAEDLLATIRSRCVPVPFRSPGWRAIAARL